MRKMEIKKNVIRWVAAFISDFQELFKKVDGAESKFKEMKRGVNTENV